jgi:predicted O-methyltransferase YrrM
MPGPGASSDGLDKPGWVPLGSVTPVHHEVGRGELGVGGTHIGGRTSAGALSTPPPARVLYRLDGRYAQFDCSVAIEEVVPVAATHADFSVLVDGTTVAAEYRVRPGATPRPVHVSVAGGQLLELRVRTSRPRCDAVWLDPVLTPHNPPAERRTLVDPLGMAELSVLDDRAPVECCLATVASAGDESQLDNLLGSLAANSGDHGATVTVISIGDAPSVAEVVARHRALLVPARVLRPPSRASRSVLCSIARLVPAARYVCLDTDMVVLGRLDPLFAALDALPPGALLAVPEGNAPRYDGLADALDRLYGGGDPPFFDAQDPAFRRSLVANDGLLAGRQPAFVALDSELRAMQGVGAWLDQQPDLRRRTRFVVNVALARLGTAVAADDTWNLQLGAQDVEVKEVIPRVARARWNGQPVRLLNVNGPGRSKHIRLRTLYAGVPEPLDAMPVERHYESFAAALREWIGAHGVDRLEGSFHGSADGTTGQLSVLDFPLYAALAALITANGCRRVFETGTYRGISAACLAAAVAGEHDARVVTFDPAPQAESAHLWMLLPPRLRECIELRRQDALAGMSAALAAGERYHAALLDTVHTRDHVLNEFELARELVCEGGLILVHDARWRGGTVDEALRTIARRGYPVVRLWTATEGTHHDDDLGLAVIECRATDRATLQPSSD